MIRNNRYIASIDYRWSKLGNLASQTDNVSLVKYGYTYDNLSRLTSYTTTVAGKHYGTVSMGYDALGNITRKSDVGTYAYNGLPANTACQRQAGPQDRTPFLYGIRQVSH